MREIKFRAWDKQYKVMGAVTLALFDTNEFDWVGNMNEPKSREHIELMQYTGLKDKNGKDIYEGDILKVGKDSGIVVGWAESIGSFCLQKLGWAFFHYFGEAFLAEESEIIGNIYENPELLIIT